MIDINLYKNYRLTLADVHKAYVAESEVFVTAYQAPSAQSSWIKKFLLTFLTATLVFALAAVAVIVILKPFSKPVMPVFISDTPFTLPEEEPKPEYIVVQAIEFADDAVSSVVSGTKRDVTPNIEVLPAIAPIQEIPIPPKVNTVPPEKQLKAEVPKAPPAKTGGKSTVAATPIPTAEATISPVTVRALFSLQLDNATQTEYELLKKMTSEYDTVTVYAESKSRLIPIWRVYLPKRGSGIFIEGAEVAPESSFATQAEAVVFAQEYGSGTVIIRMENDSYLSYNVRVCCMSNEEAKIYAQNSGITDKVFVLRKEQ